MPIKALTNLDYSDRELLHILNDVSDDEGWATTMDLANVLAISKPDLNDRRTREQYAVRCISTRFAWMARYGWVERDQDRTKWRLTPTGTQLMNGRLTKTLQASLDRMAPGDRILVMRNLTKGFRESSEAAATMLRREWQHGAGRR